MVNTSWVSILCCGIFTWKHHCARRDDEFGLAVILAVCNGDIGFIHKQILLSWSQQVPIPVVDRIVQMILHIVDDHLLVTLQFHTRSRVVSILVWHHVE